MAGERSEQAVRMRDTAPGKTAQTKGMIEGRVDGPFRIRDQTRVQRISGQLAAAVSGGF